MFPYAVTNGPERASAPVMGALRLDPITPAASIKKSRPALASTIAAAALMPRAARVAIVDVRSRFKFVVRLTSLVFISAAFILFAPPLFLRSRFQNEIAPRTLYGLGIQFGGK